MRTFVEWMNDKREEVANEKEVGTYTRKEGVLDFIDGWATGAVIAYPIVLIMAYYWRHKALKK